LAAILCTVGSHRKRCLSVHTSLIDTRFRSKHVLLPCVPFFSLQNVHRKSRSDHFARAVQAKYRPLHKQLHHGGVKMHEGNQGPEVELSSVCSAGTATAVSKLALLAAFEAISGAATAAAREWQLRPC
jgi:hypothetical protein